MNELSIIYRDADLVAINKPSGLLVHRSNIDRHEQRFALQLLRDQLGQHVYPIHRLDKPTSGVLLFALSSEVAGQLAEHFRTRAIAKTYLAIVRGYCAPQGIIDHPLKPQVDKYAGGSARADKPAQDAITHYRRLATIELPFAVDKYPHSRYSLVQAMPITGRKHQIRRHFKHIAHPIIGDAKHGKSSHNRFFQQHYGNQRLLLACTQLSLTHPVTGDRLQLNAAPGADFLTVLNQLGWAAFGSIA